MTKMGLKHKQLWTSLSVLSLLLTYLICLIPLPPTDTTSTWPMDKFFHFGIYFFHGLINFELRKNKLIVFSSLFLMGLSIELLQSLLAYRGYENLDLLANALGLFTALLLTKLVKSSFLERFEAIIYHFKR